MPYANKYDSDHHCSHAARLSPLFCCFFSLEKKLIYFQEFEDYRDADDAVYELNGKEICGER